MPVAFLTISRVSTTVPVTCLGPDPAPSALMTVYLSMLLMGAAIFSATCGSALTSISTTAASL